jgi:sRNA-binding carbon storage regulator CsrA
MLVLTRKIHEAVIINDRVSVVPTALSENEATVSVSALEPFDAWAGQAAGQDLATPERTRSFRTKYEFQVKPDEWIVIDDDITVIFFVALINDGETVSKARFGFESPDRTKLQSKNVAGSIVKEYEVGSEPTG